MQRYRAVSLMTILLLAGVLAWRAENSLDLGFHLATGRFILDNADWPATDIFTYTVPDHPYIDMHGLFQVVLALVHDALGLVGVGMLRVLFVLATTGVVWAATLERGVRSTTLLLAGFTFGLIAWEPRFFTRPELLTYPFLALELYLLQRHARDTRPIWLYAIIPIQLLWTQSHAFSLFGPVVLGLYAVAGLLRGRRRDRHPWIALGLSVAALCVNPYGFRGVLFLFNLHRHLAGADLFGVRITELASPFAASSASTWPLAAFKLLLIISVAAVLSRGRRARPFDLGLLILFGGLAVVAIRNIPLFVIALLPVTLERAQDLADRLPLPKPRLARVEVAATLVVIVALLLLISQVVAGGYYAVDHRINAFGHELSRAEFPVRSVDYLVEHGIRGPIYNQIGFGGYLIQRLWPREKVFIDGRLDVMGTAFFREYELINEGPGWAEMMRRHDPNAVLIPHFELARVRRLIQDPEWALVELDGVAALFLRTREQNAGLIRDARKRLRTASAAAAAQVEPLEPRRGLGWTERWFGRARFPWEAYGRTVTLGNLGFDLAARGEARRALLEAGRDHAPLAANYAEACHRTGRSDEALAWFRRTLELAPDYPGVRERIAEIETSSLARPGVPELSTPRIVLERAERPGYWRATYLLEAATGYLRFQRPAAFFRETVWELVTPGWEVVRIDGDQVLVAGHGAESERVVVEFPEHNEFLPKEYEFFQSFSDGSVAIYSGHLYVTASGDDVPEEDAVYLRRLELVPEPEERLVVQGAASDGRKSWEDSHGDGTYVYFGSIEPLETTEMIAIIDPGSPAWLAERLANLLPEMFATYTERFGEALPWKPVVLFNFQDVEMSGHSSGGGTLTGLVQMSAVGRAWHEATPETAEELLYLIAHEAAHLWNSQMHPYAGHEDLWMHEGSADAFAELALLRAGYIDGDRLAARRSEALNRCASGLQNGSLTTSRERQQFRTYYSCGNIIAVWSVAALEGPYEFERLFEIWRALFDHADGDDGSYTRETYFEALESLDVDAGALEALRAFLDDEHDDPSAALVALMDHVGIELTGLDRPLPELRRDRAAAALRHLMADACDGRISFYTEGRRLRTDPIEGCEPFSEERRVRSIEGHEFGPEGDLAFEATAARCSRGGAVVLGLEDGTTVSVDCASPVPPAPTPLAFPRLSGRAVALY